MDHTQDMLLMQFRDFGIREGMEIILHSSLSEVGFVQGGAGALIQALLDAVQPESGTLIAPTLTGKAQFGPLSPPIFDVKRTTCWTGSIPETLRSREDAHRSLSPTHSVAAIGRMAENLTTGHEDCWTTCGYGSPFYRLARRNGWILLLGVTLDVNTTFHMIEDLADVRYHLQSEPTGCTIINGQGDTITRSVILNKWGTRRRFSILHDELIRQGIMSEGVIGQAKTLLINSHQLVEYTMELLRRDPMYLVDPLNEG